VPLGWVAGSGGSARDGIRAYHGSPHQFDRFDMSRIGTGEGAQAYGHGLYFAGNEGVARSYRDALSPISKAHGDVEKFLLERAGTNVRPDDVMRLFQQDEALRPFATPEIAESISRLAPSYTAAGDLSGDAVNALSRLDTLITRASPKGSMYEVRLNTTPDRLLDWDAPLSRQPQAVREAIGRQPWGDAYVNSTNLTGGQVVPRTPEGSAALRDAGVQGIQYLDAGSRATSGGELLGVTQGPKGWQAKIRVDNRGGTVFADPTQQITTSRPFQTQADAQAWADGQINGGTRNYVMFDDSLIDILRRYGLAGMLTGGAASQAQAGEPAP